MFRHTLPLLTLSALLTFGCTALIPAAPATLPPAASQAAAQAASRLNAERFFAKAETLALAPGAFAVQAESVPVLAALASESKQRDALVAAIRQDQALSRQITRFGSLTWTEQLPVLKQVMALEAKTMGFTPPPLVIEAGDQREAFFDFNPDQPGTGTVKLWPAALAKDSNPYAALMLLIHETRHSWQFQRAFGPKRQSGDVVAKGFQAAFRAQRDLSGKLTFCDFCTLLNEHEAFQTGNYVVGKLTDWAVDTTDMGCFSSQFEAPGRLKIDLLDLAKQVGPQKLLAAFNEREKSQFDALNAGH
jgi:hypothetical protein